MNIINEPCIENPQNFTWKTMIVEIEETGEKKGTSKPDNSYCNSCDFFTDCLRKRVNDTIKEPIDVSANDPVF